MGMTPEGKIKKKLNKMLGDFTQYGLWSFPPQSGPFGSAGIPDRIVCAGGHFIGIEAKADKTKKPTDLQVKCMGDIERAGGKCFVVYDDETIEEVAEYLRCL
jgi:hypothetical protein